MNSMKMTIEELERNIKNQPRNFFKPDDFIIYCKDSFEERFNDFVDKTSYNNRSDISYEQIAQLTKEFMKQEEYIDKIEEKLEDDENIIGIYIFYNNDNSIHLEFVRKDVK